MFTMEKFSDGIKYNVQKRYLNGVLKNFKSYTGIISFINVILILCIVGMFFYFSLQINNIIKIAESRMEITVFLDNEMSMLELNKLIKDIELIDGVKNVIYVSKEKAYEEFCRNNEMRRLIGAFGSENPLPSSLRIHILKEFYEKGDIHNIASRISEKIKSGNIKYDREVSDELLKIVYLLNIWVMFFWIILGIISLILIINNFTFTILSRANNNYAYDKLPIIMEGILDGLAGSSIVVLLLYILHRLIRHFSRVLFDANLPSVSFIPLLSIIGIGLILGALGSALALRRTITKKNETP